MMDLQSGEREDVVALIAIGQGASGPEQGHKSPIVLRESLQIALLRSAIIGGGLQMGECGLQFLPRRPCAKVARCADSCRIDHKEKKSDCDRALKHLPPEAVLYRPHNITLILHLWRENRGSEIENPILTAETRKLWKKSKPVP